MNKHIILVGFMCSGKTTLGKQLSKVLNIPFVDIDEYIEQKHNKSVTDIFTEYGEQRFRQLEHLYIQELTMVKSATIIASGGGTPCFNNNMELMNERGITVYLKAEPTTLFNWVNCATNNRPLLNGKTDEQLLQYIEELLELRKVFYEQAQITISAVNPNIKELCMAVELLNAK